eukprot:4106762-Prymnesium_polylepis.1
MSAARPRDRASFIKWLQSLDFCDSAAGLLWAAETDDGWAQGMATATFARLAEPDVPTVFTPPPA